MRNLLAVLAAALLIAGPAAADGQGNGNQDDSSAPDPGPCGYPPTTRNPAGAP